jgi:hypothetical protein
MGADEGVMRMRRVVTVLAILAAVLVLTACQPVRGQSRVLAVKEGSDGVPLLVVTWCGSGDPIEHLSVVEADAEKPGALWGISRGPEYAAFTRMRLGVVPPGYRSASAPLHLEHDQTYLVYDDVARVEFRLDQLERDRLWNGDRHVDVVDQRDKCDELQREAERRASRWDLFIGLIVLAVIAIPLGLVFLAIYIPLRDRDHRRALIRAAAGPAVGIASGPPRWPPPPQADEPSQTASEAAAASSRQSPPDRSS